MNIFYILLLTYSGDAITTIESDQIWTSFLYGCPLICDYKRTIDVHSANIEQQFADSTI